MDNILELLAQRVERGKVNKKAPFPSDLKDEDGADEITKKALEEGIKAEEILNKGLIEGMKRIGVKFRENKVFVPDVLIAAKAMKAGMEHIKPFFLSNEIKMKGTVVMGTVAGDLHDIGKNILSMIIQGGGWQVVDLGTDVNTDKFLAAIDEHKPAAVAMSALLTTTMLNMKEIVKEVSGKYSDVITLVGGAPLTKDFADQIGADFYSPDPQEALDYLNEKAEA